MVTPHACKRITGEAVRYGYLHRALLRGASPGLTVCLFPSGDLSGQRACGDSTPLVATLGFHTKVHRGGISIGTRKRHGFFDSSHCSPWASNRDMTICAYYS